MIDFHTHTFPDKIASKTIEALERVGSIKATTDGTISGLIHSMEQAGIDQSVHLPVLTKPEQFQTVFQESIRINETYGGRIIAFAGVHPQSSNIYKELKEVKSAGIKGIKIHPDYQKTMIDNPMMLRLIDIASELDLIIVTHGGIDIGLPNPVHCSPQKVRCVLEQVRPTKFVVAHLGGWKLWDEVEELLLGQDVYLDTSFLKGYIQGKQLQRIVDQHTKNHILFASDSPWESQKDSVEMIHQLDLDLEKRTEILHDNAAKLLQLIG